MATLPCRLLIASAFVAFAVVPSVVVASANAHDSSPSEHPPGVQPHDAAYVWFNSSRSQGEQATAAEAPVVTLTATTVSWPADSGATSYMSATSTAARGAAGRTTVYQSLGVATSWSPSPQPGKTLYYGVASNGSAGWKWSSTEVSIAWPAVAPVLTLNGNTVSWPAAAGATSYQGAISTAPRGASGRTTTYLNLGNVTSWSPPAQRGQTLYYGVQSTGPNGGDWSSEVAITWPAAAPASASVPTSQPTPAPAPAPQGMLKVGVNNATGWGPAVNSLFLKAGIPYERLDIGRGDLSMLDAAISRGMKDLPVYASGSTGNLNDVTPANVTSDITALIPQLVSRGITTLEFGNEVYNSISPAQYAALYNAAHVAAAGRIKLIAVATTDYYDQRSGGSGNWFVDVKNALPGGVAEVDGWTIHPYGSLTSVCGDGSGWPMLGPLHTESVNAGFSSKLPWFITEVGQEISGSRFECQAPVTLDQQATAMTQYLNDLKTQDPWVVWIDWYAACDDGSGGFGLINENSSGECGVPGTTVRPAFTAMANWVATNGEG